MQVYLTATEAGQKFPIPISAQSAIHRMKTGINGIRLEHVYDGYRYSTTAEWIDDFIRKVTESRGKSPVVERLDDTSVARFKALIRRKTRSHV